MEIRSFFAAVAVPAALLLSIQNANAAPVSAAVALKDFNAIIYGNASTQSDIEGAAVIGGNFSGATINSAPPASLPSTFGTLTVYGKTSGNSINMNNAGSAYVGGTKGAKINFNGGGSYLGAPDATISEFETEFNGLSTSLSKLSATGALPTTTNNEIITATPNKNGIAVFDITAAQLDSIPSYKINLNGASTVIFNVDATDTSGNVSFNANDESGVTGADNIIWNFYNATKVSLGTQIAGTVLAVQATVSNSNQIDGDLIANSWTGGGELHNYGFEGVLPGGVPEPATWAMMLVGFGALGAAMRSRRRRSTLTA